MIGFGILAALAAALGNAISVVLQASEARLTPDAEGMHLSLLRHLTHRPRWMIGTGLLVVVWALQVLALSLAPIAVVQPMLATSQLVLLAVARVKLGERIGRTETLATFALVAGLGAIVWSAPDHTIVHAASSKLAPPMALVGGAAIAAYLVGRWNTRLRLLLVIGAGIAFSWSDFVTKLLSDDLSSNHWLLAIVWAAATVAIGAIAFLEENTALQHRPTVTVAPVIAAIKVPLPVLMALWAGLGNWNTGGAELATMIMGLTLVALGAASLGRSSAVLRISAEDEGQQQSEDGQTVQATGVQEPTTG